MSCHKNHRFAKHSHSLGRLENTRARSCGRTHAQTESVWRHFPLRTTAWFNSLPSHPHSRLPAVSLRLSPSSSHLWKEAFNRCSCFSPDPPFSLFITFSVNVQCKCLLIQDEPSCFWVYLLSFDSSLARSSRGRTCIPLKTKKTVW